MRSIRWAVAGSCLAAMLLAPGAAGRRSWGAVPGKGADFYIGGPGTAPGKFNELRDMTFDAGGALYTLEGLRTTEKKDVVGNLRLQKFDRAGKPAGLIDLHDAPPREPLGKLNNPQRIAVDAAGNIYVTQPTAGKVEQFGPDGKWARSYDVPRAMAISVARIGGEERIAVVPSRKESIRGAGNKWMDGDKVVVLSPAGGIESTLPLNHAMEDVHDMAVDGDGNFYVLAEPRALYKFSPAGELLHTYGGNHTTRQATDGSEVHHTVAVDSKGNVYTMGGGNPALITRFDADGQTVTQRSGDFAWATPWSTGSYTLLAIDPGERLWIGVPRQPKPDDPKFKTSVVPAILRVEPGFFDQKAQVAPLYAQGFRAELRCALPYSVSYDPAQPTPMELVVAAANRAVDRITVDWQALDPWKNETAHGRFDLPLSNNEEGRASFSFTPQRFGSYMVVARASAPQGDLAAISHFVGVAPRYARLPALAQDECKGGLGDSPRQACAGLMNVRLHPNVKNMEQLDMQLELAEKYGVTSFVQLAPAMKELTPQLVREVATHCKGRVKVYEVCNEPNFSGNPKSYFQGHKMAYEIIKEIDPQAKVMGPATVTIRLDWLDQLYKMGFKDVCDIVSFHDYEGNGGSFDTPHMQWKLAECRRIMGEHGDADKPIWQTEVAIGVFRGRTCQALSQAISLVAHHELLEMLGIPTEHNNHFYLNEHGFSKCPSYVWSAQGPFPAAMAMRTRYGLTGAQGRRYAGQLDFGPSGNPYLMGNRYVGDDGVTVVLRNLGTRDMPLDFEVHGASHLDLVDVWGNASRAAVKDGQTRLVLRQTPTYALLPPGATLAAPRLDFGKNLAPQARFSYSAPHGFGVGQATVEPSEEITTLNNGVVETNYDGDPNGGIDGLKIWRGELPQPSKDNPQFLEMTFASPQRIGAVILRGVFASNAFGYLLDYDLQYRDGDRWITIETLDRTMPRTELIHTVNTNAQGVAWGDDTNFFIHRFAPVTAAKLRLAVRGATYGMEPDEVVPAWGLGTKPMPPRVYLREVEIYGPQ